MAAGQDDALAVRDLLRPTSTCAILCPFVFEGSQSTKSMMGAVYGLRGQMTPYVYEILLNLT